MAGGHNQENFGPLARAKGETRVRAVLTGYGRFRVVRVVHTDDDRWIVEAYHTAESKVPVRSYRYGRFNDAKAAFTAWCFAR